MNQSKASFSIHSQIPLDTLPCGICRLALDNQFTILYANDFYYHMLGYTREQGNSSFWRTPLVSRAQYGR